MTNIFALTKVLIKNNVFGLSSKNKKGKSSSTKGSLIGIAILFGFCIFAIAFPIIYTLKDILKEYNMGELILSFAIPLGGLTAIIFGIFSTINIFYFNKDSEQLLPLPIKSSELLFAKFFASLISNYLILFMFIYPIIFGVGIGSGASFLFYIYALLVCILMPIIPSIIMSIVLMICNKFFNFSKKKDLFMYIMTGLVLVFSFTYSFGIQYLLNSGEESQLLELINGNYNGYIKISHYLFPFFNSAVFALVKYKSFVGFASLMTYLGLNLLFLVILYFVGDKLYIKGLTKNNGSGQSKKVALEEIYKERKGSVTGELIKKEWRSIKRSPTFMLNTVIVNLIFPIMFLIMFLIGFVSTGANMQQISIAISGLIDFKDGAILFIVIGALMFLASMTSPSCCAISREGKSAWMMKTIPVSLKKQLDAKVYFSLLINLIVLALMEIIFFVVFIPPWYYFFFINIPMILYLLISNYLSLLLDLRKPRLDWSEEAEAVKQNFNVFFSVIINMIVEIGLVLVGVFLFGKKTNIYLIFSLMSVILLVIYVAINLCVKKYQNKLFSKVG